jgi:two-component system, sensor histidine kinase and response regulator
MRLYRERAERPLKLLLAEDNAVNRQLALAVLQTRGHEVSVAVNGREAVEAVEREPFDLVLMDVQMPEMGGLEATGRIRAREAATGEHLPIFAMTAHALKGDRERCLEAGMDGYISKPIDRRELLNLVESVQPKVGAAASTDQNAGLVMSAVKGADPVNASSFSPDVMLARLGGDESLARELAGLFVSECPKMLTAVRDSVADGSAEAIRRAAHALKGSVANFTDGGAMTTAFALEQMGRDGRVAEAPAMLIELERELDILLQHLRDFGSGVPCAS